MTDLGFQGYAIGINDVGQIVGMNTNGHAFLYSNGQMQDLGTLPGCTVSTGFSVNISGQVVGVSQSSNGLSSQAFLYSGGQMQAIGTLGGTYSWAYGINNAGQIVGQNSTASGYLHAFLYSGGQMQDIDTIGSEDSCAYGINSEGQVVGEVAHPFFGTEYTFHAFLYSNGTMTDLNTLIASSSGWTLIQANAINDEGQIVGIGTNPAGQEDAFLLTPTPEPATLTLLALGGLALVRGKRSGSPR